MFYTDTSHELISGFSLTLKRTKHKFKTKRYPLNAFFEELDALLRVARQSVYHDTAVSRKVVLQTGKS